MQLNVRERETDLSLNSSNFFFGGEMSKLIVSDAEGKCKAKEQGPFAWTSMCHNVNVVVQQGSEIAHGIVDQALVVLSGFLISAIDQQDGAEPLNVV